MKQKRKVNKQIWEISLVRTLIIFLKKYKKKKENAVEAKTSWRFEHKSSNKRKNAGFILQDLIG